MSFESRVLTWTGSRSLNLGVLVKPFFRGSREKWLLGIKMDKMVTRGRLGIHLQNASQLSKEWGEGHLTLATASIRETEWPTTLALSLMACLLFGFVRLDYSPGSAGEGDEAPSTTPRLTRHPGFD